MARVRIVKKPTAKTGLEVKMQPGLYGTNGNRQFSLPTQIDSQKYSEPDTEVRNTLQPVPREEANLEAEKGETAVVNIDGFPAHFNIGGKRHSQGGTPLNLPDDSFIFSDTAKMKIKDPEILKQFGMSLKSGGYTPADIAKKYQINKFRRMLADPKTDDLQRSTAEMMIANYNEKLAKLALAQESKKGFPQGLPAIAMPYIQAHNIDPTQYIFTQGQEFDPNANMGVARYGANVVVGWKAQAGATVTNKGADFSDVVSYLRERDAAKAKEKLYQDAYNKAYAAEMKKWEENKAKEKAEANRLANKKRSQYVQENELKRRENIVRQLTNELKSGKHDANATESKLNKALSDYQVYKNQYFPTTITYNTPKQEKPSSKPYVMSEGEKEYFASKHPKTITLSKSEVMKLDDDAFANLEKKYTGYNVIWKEQEGGSLPTAQFGAIKKARSAAKPQGNIVVQKSKPKASAKPAQKTFNKYDPYGGYTEEELANLLEDPSILRKSKVEGYQKEGKEGTKGHFGIGVTLDEFVKRNPEYAKAFEEKYGRKFDSTKDAETFQKEYNKHVGDLAYKRAIDAGYDETQAKSLSKKFVESQGFKEGVKEGTGDPRGIDKKFGEFTSSRFEPSFKSVKKPEPEPFAPKVDIKLPGKQPDAERPSFEKPQLNPVKADTYAPWWLQDIIGTAGAWGDMVRIKKYQPWQATPQTFLPQATFYDPTRELAANAEQANIASQFHQAFTGPKTGQMASVQGQAMKNAADIMSRYNNMNVGVANQLEQERAQIMNQASQQRAGLDTQLWDKYTIANQQFDNAKNQAREQLRKHVISAVTNRAKTQALNSLYPNYYTDPSTGGMLSFHPDFSKIQPTHPDFSNPYLEAVKLTGDPDRALRYLELQNKGAMSNPYDERRGYMGAQGYGE